MTSCISDLALFLQNSAINKRQNKEPGLKNWQVTLVVTLLTSDWEMTEAEERGSSGTDCKVEVATSDCFWEEKLLSDAYVDDKVE